ncbi:hypothetical protein QTP88_024990 [Uroleucon formosanum]
MSKPKGGWEKLKETQKKKKNEADFLKKVNPLTSYFIPKYTNSENTINKEDNIINTSTSDSHNVPSLSNSFIGASSKNNDVIEYSNDPGDWNLTSHNLISYLIEKGPKFFQNINADFSLTKKYYENPKVNRCLNQTAFFYTKPNDSELEKQLTETRDYWKNVLRRIIETILFLSGRGLPFRGSDEHFGSNHNGNYLGILELLSKFDPFLAQHIAVHGNQGKGHTSYLSKTICNEFIALIANKTRTMIIDQLKKAGYFSISVDSTPDITHMDQLTIILRYVNNDGPVERFITFIHITSHTGANLALCLLNFLKENGINIENCRGQSYDNASNMSGTYTGMQAEIKKCNSFIDYIPCIAHSLNLVGQSAVDCCVEAVSFFGFVQEVYNFFFASTQRWDILKKTLVKNCPVPKSKSVTRWSANAEAVKALFLSYENINEALRKIQNDTSQKQSTRHQASCLSSILGHLETGIMCELWHNILEPFNKCSKSIQSGIIDLYTAINLIESLKIVLQNIRNQYDEYESNGMKRAKNEHYKLTRHRKKFKRNESGFNELNAKESFKINTFYVIIDQLYSALVHRINAYTTVRDNFKLLSDISMDMQIEDIEGGMKKLLERYPKDFPDDFTNEFKQFLSFSSTSLSLITTNENKNKNILLNMYKMIIDLNVTESFPNIERLLRLYLSLMCTNCTGERSFSRLKLLKNVLRSSLSQNNLQNLGILSIESEFVKSLNFEDVIQNFANEKSRKKELCFDKQVDS